MYVQVLDVPLFIYLSECTNVEWLKALFVLLRRKRCGLKIEATKIYITFYRLGQYPCVLTVGSTTTEYSMAKMIVRYLSIVLFIYLFI